MRGNVFMTIASDRTGEEYRLHPLFQSFLRRRLRAEAGLNGLTAEHGRLADYFWICRPGIRLPSTCWKRKTSIAPPRLSRNTAIAGSPQENSLRLVAG